MKKIAPIVLLAALSISWIAGCSKSEETAMQPATQEQKSQTPSPQGTTEATE